MITTHSKFISNLDSSPFHSEGVMKEENQSSTMGFILLGIIGQQQQEDVFFILFLFIYLITLIGNLLIVLVIRSDIRLHNPMYFFLANLSFVDILFSSVTVPKMLSNHFSGSKAVSFGGCITQMYFMIDLATTDSYILAVMAYDRAVAISRPLHYTTIMSPMTCFLLVVGSWVIANANTLPHILLTASLSFCGNQEVANFYCDISSLLKLSCSDIHFNVKMMYLGLGIFCVPLICIIISYIWVFSTVLRVPSTKGVLKAFSTCASHLTVVSLYYGTVMGMYFRPLTSYSLKDAVITMMYTAVTPMLNPFIYSLRNRDVKAALGKLFSKTISS
ncbi:olfactory receptor 1A1-like [Trichechus manatus latirostris]|uniref:Olfactory receptor 1A1-like n=1 Tax=Trichechus manatus latirostris TaxID=127582 RepID=A0A2Y9DK92_TRIMA|nr:olfactory receptor 1A1-like [Trichechus manatus latirostris]